MRIMKEWGGDTFFNDGVYGGAHTENKPRTSTWQMLISRTSILFRVVYNDDYKSALEFSPKIPTFGLLDLEAWRS